jgi:hypothetical protein
MWHKGRAQLSHGVAGRPHHLGQLAMCWCISKNHFVYVSSRGGAQGIQWPKAVQGGNLPPGQVACSADLTSGPPMPNLWPEHRLTPINTMVLPPAESVKKVRFSPPPPRGLQIQSL